MFFFLRVTLFLKNSLPVNIQKEICRNSHILNLRQIPRLSRLYSIFSSMPNFPPTRSYAKNLKQITVACSVRCCNYYPSLNYTMRFVQRQQLFLSHNVTLTTVFRCLLSHFYRHYFKLSRKFSQEITHQYSRLLLEHKLRDAARISYKEGNLLCKHH